MSTLRPVVIIAALQEKDRGIGKSPDLLFRISDDLKRFKRLTSGNSLIMGRKTFDSLGTKPLPNRLNIVLTRDTSMEREEGVVVAHSLEEALELAAGFGETTFIIGGGEIYRQALPFAERLELTIAKSDVEGDTFFPDYAEFSTIVSEESHHDEKTGLDYRFVTLTR